MESSFYSTSAFITYRPSDAASAVAGGMPLQSTCSAPGSPYQLGETSPRALYSMASDPYATEGSNAVTPLSMASGGRPGGIIIIGKKESPVGDAVLPFLACMLVYGAWKLRRMFRFSKK